MARDIPSTASEKRRTQMDGKSMLKASAVMCVLCLSVLGVESQAQACNECSPGANEVCLYRNLSFCGDYRRLQIGNYGWTIDEVTLPNDTISSFIVGSAVKIKVCQNGSYEGNCDTHTGPTYISLDSGSWCSAMGYTVCDNQISSLRVQPTSINCASPGPYQCSFFTDWHHSNDCVVLNMGYYSTPGEMGIHNDWLSSVKCGSNASADLYQNASWGTYLTTIGPWNDTTKPGWELGAYNDVVSSVVVR
jgi:hypothetical protein